MIVEEDNDSSLGSSRLPLLIQTFTVEHVSDTPSWIRYQFGSFVYLINRFYEISSVNVKIGECQL